MSSNPPPKDTGHRAGFVAILGPPNAGKSTLMNRILGQKLAIVTAKPQTTRSRILGIHNTDRAQLLFIDTPGLHESEKLLNIALNEAVDEAVRGCDVGVVLVDLSSGWEEIHDTLRERLARYDKPMLVVGTKCDLPGASPALEIVPGPVEPLAVLRASGLTGEGVKAVEEAIADALPQSPALYDDETLTDRPVRWLAGEFVREAVFGYLGQELPYAMAVDVIKYEQHEADRVTIHANILVMRDSQKRIVVGKGGEMVKRIGIRARKEIEQLTGARVHLELFVKVDPKWLKSAKRIDALGYN
ncbi:MAG: GTPase Era [bacterium]|nr:GTPase Era [bacterium]